MKSQYVTLILTWIHVMLLCEKSGPEFGKGLFLQCTGWSRGWSLHTIYHDCVSKGYMAWNRELQVWDQHFWPAGTVDRFILDITLFNVVLTFGFSGLWCQGISVVINKILWSVHQDSVALVTTNTVGCTSSTVIRMGGFPWRNSTLMSLLTWCLMGLLRMAGLGQHWL